MDEKASPWNSLEIAKLFTGLLTPLMVAIVGYILNQQLTEQTGFEKSLAERRFQIYDTIREGLNRIYCYVEDKGTWKQEDPDKILTYKRMIDQAMFTQRAFWGPDTFKAFTDYMDSAFATYQGVGVDARIKSGFDEKQSLPGWKSEWASRFTGHEDSSHEANYNRLQSLIARDLMLR
jgi:hypothetical protein